MSRHDKPFLHTSAGNTAAIRLYESLGFRLRHRPAFVLACVPAVESATMELRDGQYVVANKGNVRVVSEQEYRSTKAGA